MAATIIYYGIRSTTDIAKLAVEYRKIQEISKLRTELERQKSISESIQSYTRLIKSDVQALMHMYFKSAIENLYYALTASGENQKEYLRQARNRFIDATTIEKNENLILSYIGLSLCQVLTNDNENSYKSISKIRNIQISLSEYDDKELMSMMKCCNECMGFIAYSCLYRNGWLGDNIIVKSIDELIDHYVKEITNNIILETCFPIEYEQQELKKYIKRFMNALKICGGFSLNETTLVENAKRAIKKILQEDFEAFKSEVLRQFNL